MTERSERAEKRSGIGEGAGGQRPETEERGEEWRLGFERRREKETGKEEREKKLRK